jgi:hypothetical protein
MATDPTGIPVQITAIQQDDASLSGPAFMALELVPGALADVTGEVRYPPPFGLESARP